jgi:hypothetical protein
MKTVATFAFLLLCAGAASAQQVSCPARGTVVYFGNGVNTSAIEADATARDRLPGLASEAGIAEPLDFKVAYNQSNGLFDDLIETMAQKAAEDDRFTWFMMNNVAGYLLRGLAVPTRILDGLPGGAGFVAQVQEVINQAIAESGRQSTSFYNADVGEHTRSYASDVRNGYRAMVVAHSQGNLFANAARGYLPQLAPEFASSFGIVSVATPAEVAHDGYVTSSNDAVIGLLRQLGRTVLPANITVPLSLGDVMGHAFEDIYINASLPARSRVVALLGGLGTRLTFPPRFCPAPRPAGAPSLFGAHVELSMHCCTAPDDATLLSPRRYSTVGAGVELPDLSGARGGVFVIAADMDVLESSIDIVYNQAASSVAGAFNGYILRFSGGNVPRITSAAFGSESSVNLGNATVSVEDNAVSINVPSTTVAVGSRINVQLTLE